MVDPEQPDEEEAGVTGEHNPGHGAPAAPPAAPGRGEGGGELLEAGAGARQQEDR